MRMGFELMLEQQQKLVMTPELKLALKILQLPAVELESLIQHELESNPILDVLEETKEDKSEASKDLNDKNKEKEIDWKEYLQYQGKSYNMDHFDTEDASEASLDNIITYSTTLKDYLLSQLQVTHLTNEEMEIGEFIINSLDENGYLTIALEEISSILGKDVSEIEEMLQIVQTFEPYGVGARDLKECLMIQIRNKDIQNDKLELIVNNYLDDIANNRLQSISKKLGVSVEDIQKLSDAIKQLEPKPGRSFEGENTTRYVVPDVFIDKIGNEYIITVNDYNGSRLMINQYYKNILQSEDKASQATQYINNKLSSAMWLIKSLEHRRNTLYNVMQAILNYQMDFFERGAMYLKTMTLKAIADEVDVHESTVSRAISGKYVQTPRGVFEIKYFFKSGVDSQQGDTVSSESIKKMIKKQISEEDNSKPISDQDIADLLNKNGFMISRRTVAKYRDDLGIPSSSKRKRY